MCINFFPYKLTFRLISTQVLKKFAKLEVFYEIVDFFVFDMCSKPIFCSKIAEKGKSCSRLLKPQKIVPNSESCSNVASTMGTGLPPRKARYSG